MSIPPPSNPPPAVPNCPRCGTPNEAGLIQCAHCGQSLATAWPPPGGYAPTQDFAPQTTIGRFGGMIPDKNPAALAACCLGIFSIILGIFPIIPWLAFPMGIAAVVLGLKGLKLVKERPEVRGRTHAWVGTIVGGLFMLLNIGLLVLMAVAAGTRH